MDSLNLPPVPPTLKNIQHVLEIANHYESKGDFLISYWTRLYAFRKGNAVTNEDKYFLSVLLDWLDAAKLQVDSDAELIGKAQIQSLALELFNWADSADRIGECNGNIVKAFFTSVTLFDVLSVFQGLVEVEHQYKYAKCRALHLAHCLNTGTVPSKPQKFEENGCFSTNPTSYLDEEETFELLPFQAELASSRGFLNIPKTSYNKNQVTAEKINGLSNITFGSCASAVGGKRKVNESFCAHPAIDEAVKVCERQEPPMKISRSVINTHSNLVDKQPLSRVVHRDEFLRQDEIEAIGKKTQLSSAHMNAAQTLIRNQFPEIGGLNCTTLGATLDFPNINEHAKWMQILHDGHDHWLLVAKGFITSAGDEICVYDSLVFEPHKRKHAIACIACLVRPSKKELNYIVKHSQKQQNDYDCGVFVIAFATSLAFGSDPSSFIYEDDKIRQHLKNCFSSGKLSEFPSRVRVNRTLSYSSNEAYFKADIICHCRRTKYALQTKTADWDMMQCASCSEVFHKKCEKWRLDASSNERHLWKCKKCQPIGPKLVSEFLSIEEIHESFFSLKTNWVSAFIGLTDYIAECPCIQHKKEIVFIPNVIILGNINDYWLVIPLKRDLLSCQMILQRPFATRRIFSRQYRPMKEVTMKNAKTIDFSRSANSVEKYISSDDWEKYLELKEIFSNSNSKFNQILLKKYRKL